MNDIIDYLRKIPAQLKSVPGNLYQLLIQLVFAVIVGICAGGTGILFYHLMVVVTGLRMSHAWLLFFLPFGGLLIVFLYRITGEGGNKGTDLILDAVHNDEEVPVKVAPLIFVSTLITHLFGGSAGREGAALQIGGSIGGFLGKLFRFNDERRHVFILCGMSACFSAVFGTPLAAAIFSLEVVSVGAMQYYALVPCVVASFTASSMAHFFNAAGESYLISDIPDFSFVPVGKIIIISIIIAAVSVLFCHVLHGTGRIFRRLISDQYIRIFTGGLIIIGFVYLFGTRDYLGAGIPVIEACFEDGVPWYSFLLKILFTAVTLGSGFKGGEIVPAFFTGATLGCALGSLFGLPSTLCAACGMVGLFCGVTNCPVTAILMGFEMFGTNAMPYYVITIAVSYMMSGYYGLYSSQKIVYSKYFPKRIDRNAH